MSTGKEGIGPGPESRWRFRHLHARRKTAGPVTVRHVTPSGNDIRVIPVACGMPLVAEPFATAGSAALTCLLPLGTACFPEAEDGAAALLAELVLRGVEGLDARQHSDALDRLGVQRSVTVGTYHLHLSATMLGSRLEEALPLITAMITRPALPASALDAARSLCLQSLAGLDDEPQERVMVRLRERHLPAPINRHSYGRREVLEQLPIDALVRAWKSRCVPRGAIFAVAGRCDPDRVAAALNEQLEGWTGAWTEPAAADHGDGGIEHLAEETAQTHMGIAWNAPIEGAPGSMTERLATRILGGGSSSRLFTEVRERRGLCYSVGAGYTSSLRRAMVTIYAGSTPQRAQQTLDVILEQVEQMRTGVTDAEFARAVTGFKSRLVMQGESTAARAASIAADQFRLGRPRSLGEIAAEVDAVTLDQLNAWLRERPAPPPTLVSLGPAPLAVPTA